MATNKKAPKLEEVDIKPHHYPSVLKLDEEDFKDIKDWKVGETYCLRIVVKQVKAAQGEEYMPYGDTDADKVHAEFQVEKVLEGEPYDEKEEKDEKEEDDEEEETPKVTEAIRRKFKK